MALTIFFIIIDIYRRRSAKRLAKVNAAKERMEGESIEFFKDRLLLLYTDGLNEAENPQQEQFGEDHIIKILTSQSSKKAQNIVETLKAAVELHRDGAEPNDDLTMLCMKLL